jgi:hypothetical protein
MENVLIIQDNNNIMYDPPFRVYTVYLLVGQILGTLSENQKIMNHHYYGHKPYFYLQ